jgi:hypothetical protein
MYLHSFSTVLSALVHSVWTIFLSQGKGVYQFVKKYGANVDGYRYSSQGKGPPAKGGGVGGGRRREQLNLQLVHQLVSFSCDDVNDRSEIRSTTC